MELREKQLAFFNETISYYDNYEKFCYAKSGCYYSPENAGKTGISEGCAIGRHLPKDLQKEFDILDFGEIARISKFHKESYNKMPNSLKELGVDFLSEMQNYHDVLAQGGGYDVEKTKRKIFENYYRYGKVSA